jgi:hypothetical protein
MAGVRDGATVSNDGGDSGMVTIEALCRLEVSWVQVLRAVREKVEP